MTLAAIKPLVDSGIINEDTRIAITEAWEAQLAEAKEQVRGELREEFARRYEHDKSEMVKALNSMVTESLETEIVEFKEEKDALAKDRVAYKKQVQENAKKFNDFLVGKLAEELKELREDRKAQKQSLAGIQRFVAEQLSSEIKEFAKDKKAVVETKVRLVAEGRAKMVKLQQAFVERSAKLVRESITKRLESELTQLKEDVQIARENMFGRRLFEAFASEFGATHLNENKEIAKLQALVKARTRQLEEAKRQSSAKDKLVESQNQKIKVITESVNRKQVLADLLGPLNKEKARVMADLLENVRTEKLQSAYNKYLPAVLNANKAAPQSAPAARVSLTEGRKEVTGDKNAKAVASSNADSVVVDIKRLAGLK